jgi:DNA-directed RNA polymerase subunit RPC12/RpoP
MIEQKEYVCDRCGATFDHMEKLEDHKLTHSKDKEEEQKEVEQGIQKPTQNPTMPPSTSPPSLQKE